MPFDPSKPANNSPNSSAEMRGQLAGLKALIDAILTITSAQVDGVNTVPPGNPASVSLSVIGNTLRFTFDLPQGEVGPTGEVSFNDLKQRDLERRERHEQQHEQRGHPEPKRGFQLQSAARCRTC
jgi:hypothetical protein